MRLAWLTRPWSGGALLLAAALGVGIWLSDPARGGGTVVGPDTGATSRKGTTRGGRVAPPGGTFTGAPGAAAPGGATVPSLPGAAGRVDVVFRLPWGAGPQALGHRIPEEAAPEGPASFALGPEGSLWVLDQVNFRVQVVQGGRVVRSIPLPNDTYEDLAVDARGRLVLVDRLVQRHVAWQDAAGAPWRFVDLEGPGLPEGGGATGLFLRGDGAWVEWAHQHLVRVADAAGRADPGRPIRWGRQSADGRLLLRAVRGGSHDALVLATEARGARAGTRVLGRVTFGRPLTSLTALDSDPAGHVVLGARLLEHGSGPPFALLAEEAWAVVLRPDGSEARRVALAVNTGPEEQRQALRVGPDGSIYHLAFEDRGATLRRYRP